MESLPLPVSINPVYLTIIPRVRVGYEMVDDCFIKNAHKISRILLIFIVKKAYSYHIWRAWCIDSYTMMAEPIRALELRYPMIQFLIKSVSLEHILYTLCKDIESSFDIVDILLTSSPTC